MVCRSDFADDCRSHALLPVDKPRPSVILFSGCYTSTRVPRTRIRGDRDCWKSWLFQVPFQYASLISPYGLHGHL